MAYEPRFARGAALAFRTSMRALGLAVLMAASNQSVNALADSNAVPHPLRGVQRILFLGDSITYSGEYIDYVDAYLHTQLPNSHFELINVGLPSETVSGLSEPGHAGGAFPRPDLHERLERVLEKTRPDLVFACYGMNDGIYYPFDAGRFAAYRSGIQFVVDHVAAHHARLILLTPPTFDPQPILARTVDATGKDFPPGGTYTGYDNVLGRYAEWLLGQRAIGWKVEDIHGPMRAFLDSRRKVDPGYALAGDGVHANPFGHWLMAQAVLKGMGFKDPAALRKSVHRNQTRFKSSTVEGAAGALTTSMHFLQPLPNDPRWDARSAEAVSSSDWLRHPVLCISDLADGRYTIREGDKVLGEVSRDEIVEGFDITLLASLSATRRGFEILDRIHKRQRILTDSWLTDTGHKRPGMAKGLPLDQALAQAEEMERAIEPLCKPTEVTLTITSPLR